MRNSIIATILLSLAFAAAAAGELKQACLENPLHPICVERQAKLDARKAKREAKVADQVQLIRAGVRPADMPAGKASGATH